MANYLGVDVGYKRIGLSIGSSDLMIALPIPALIINNNIDSFQDLAKVVKDNRIDVVVFGHPLNMDGSIGNMAKYVDTFIANFRKYVPADVEFIKSDERLTSQQAETERHAVRFESAKKKRNNRRRGVIDSNAAAIILQDYMDELTRGLVSNKQKNR
ncbi:MAG: Holliday junction resolvase RuvX [Opitutales bacterium]|nr:Holliday junction resolvase RuvX [Opitutales bacterium]